MRKFLLYRASAMLILTAIWSNPTFALWGPYEPTEGRLGGQGCSTGGVCFEISGGAATYALGDNVLLTDYLDSTKTYNAQWLSYTGSIQGSLKIPYSLYVFTCGPSGSPFMPWGGCEPVSNTFQIFLTANMSGDVNGVGVSGVNLACSAPGIQCHSNNGAFMNVSSPVVTGANQNKTVDLNGVITTPSYVLISSDVTTMRPVLLPGSSKIVYVYPSGSPIPLAITLRYQSRYGLQSFPSSGGVGIVIPPIPPVGPTPVSCDTLVDSDLDLGIVDSSNAVGRSATTTLSTICTDTATVVASIRASGSADNVANLGGLSISVTFPSGTSTDRWPAGTSVTTRTISGRIDSLSGGGVPGSYSTPMVVSITYE